jgi:hypothetical protein
LLSGLGSIVLEALMTNSRWKKHQRFCFQHVFLGAFLFLAILPSARAGNLETTGITLLRASEPILTGANVIAAQPEAELTGANDWEVNPAALDGTPASQFEWLNTNGTAMVFPNDLGFYSAHANGVGNDFYSSNEGVAPGLATLHNYDAGYFYQFVVQAGTATSDQVVNQSFIFIVTNAADQISADSDYDNYAAANGTLFSSAVGNGGQVYPPGTAYDSIGAGAYGFGSASSVGPTVDNGRSKPDLVAAAPVTSESTPYIAGAAAVLLQAAQIGDGGTNISASSDARTLKALLINGALKPFDWAHISPAPLDRRYGAGVMNVFNSYQQLAGGQQVTSASTNISSGSSHPPGNGRVISSLQGWDFQTITTPAGDDTVNHYYFNLPAATNGFTLTATLVWNRAAQATSINQLGLFLYNSSNGTLSASSTSAVDNVQHVYLPQLAAGSYDLQVVKFGALTQLLSPSETYALAFQFHAITRPALMVKGGASPAVWWTNSPTIFTLQQTSSLSPPISWSNAPVTQWITNNVVWADIATGGATAFYRLALAGD